MVLVKTTYKQTEVGMIPEDWNIKSFKEIFRVNQGLQIAIEKRFKYPSRISKKYITIQFLNEGKLVEYINDYSKSVCCAEDDILMTRTGNTGMVVTNINGVFHNNFFKINFDRNKLDKNYIVYFLNQTSTQKKILEKAGTSTIPDLNHKDFYSLEIPLPPTLTEQKAIATALSDVDELISSLELLITKKKAIKQGSIQQLLTGKTRLKGFEGNGQFKPTDVGFIPEDWDVFPLKELLIENPKYGIGAAASEFNYNSFTYLRITDIDENGRILKDGLKSVEHPDCENYILAKGELVFARTGASVGKSYLYNPSDGKLVFAGFLIKIKPDNKKLNSRFLRELVNTKAYWNWVTVNSMRSGQPGINSNELGTFLIPLPQTLTEQKAIATALGDMDIDIDLLENKKVKYQSIKQGMMQELLTGKTRLV